MKKLLLIGAALLILPLQAGAGLPLKNRKQLEHENEQLRQRLEALQQEIEWLRNDINERDSLRKALVEMYREDENKEAAGLVADYFDTPGEGEGDGFAYEEEEAFEPRLYTDEITDSLLSIWYLHRQTRDNPQGDQYNMDSVHFTSEVPDRVLIERLERMNSFIRLPYNETVKNYMVLYAEKMPTKMGQMLGLAQYYMPIFEEAFRKYILKVISLTLHKIL